MKHPVYYTTEDFFGKALNFCSCFIGYQYSDFGYQLFYFQDLTFALIKAES